MTKTRIYLSRVSSVKEFVDKMSRLPYPVYVINGTYRISAKSILGIFEADLASPIVIQADCKEEENESFREIVKPWEE